LQSCEYWIRELTRMYVYGHICQEYYTTVFTQNV